MQKKLLPQAGSEVRRRAGCIAARGFSFAEVMFAVVILGIGFIMVAAIFPVAIKQTQTTGEENIAAALARQAANSISQMPTTFTNPNKQLVIYTQNPAPSVAAPVAVPTELLFPPTVKNYWKPDTNANAPVPPAIVVPFTGNRWDMVKSNCILPSDPRYGYVLFYKRESNSSAAQLIVVAVSNRNRPVYDPAQDIVNYPNSTAAITLTPGDYASYVSAPQTNTYICPDTLTTAASVREGYCFEVLSTTIPLPAAAGRSYTVGQQYGAAWELTAGDSMSMVAGSKGWGAMGCTIDTTPPPPPGAINANVSAPATLQPTVAYARLYSSPTSPAGQITLFADTPDLISNNPAPPPAAAQGAFVIIADDFPLIPGAVSQPTGIDYKLPDNIAGNPGYSVGSMNGRIFRLGSVATTKSNGSAALAGTFNLDPAYGMRPATGGGQSPDTIPNPIMVPAYTGADASIGGAKVYIIGVGRADPNPANAGYTTYTGAAQDIGVYTSFFQVQ